LDTLTQDDVMLIQLKRPVDSAKPARLPKDMQEQLDMAPGGAKLEVFGWGGTNRLATQWKELLQWGNVEVSTKAACADDLAQFGFSKAAEQLGASHICVRPASFVSTCFGDSGGGLIAQKPNGDHVVLGVFSELFPANGNSTQCSKGRSVYASIARHTPWIRACMNNPERCEERSLP
jgi:secreted trypsin-like serine protease